MIEYLGIAAPADVGYYSGLVDSAFSLVQALTVREINNGPLLPPLTLVHLLDLLLVVFIQQNWAQTRDIDRCDRSHSELCLIWSQSLAPRPSCIAMSSRSTLWKCRSHEHDAHRDDG